MSIADKVPSDLTVVYRPPSELRPFKHNARTHPRRQIDQIAASIEAFGFVNPILVDPDGEIIAGHGRLLAAKQIDLGRVPTITVAGLSDHQKRALRLADNKIGLNAAWDTEMLRIELGELSALDSEISIDLTGFSPGEIDVALTMAVDPDDEAIPPVPADPVTQLGEIWQLGEHRLGCGDGGDGAFLRAVIGSDQLIDAAFLDPPYNVSIAGHANVKSGHREFAMASGEMSAAEFGAFLEQTLGACAAVSRDGAVHFVCMDWRHMDDLSAVGRRIYGDLLNVCIWNKSNAGMGSLYRSKHELIYVWKVGTGPHLNTVELGKHGRNRTNVWDYASVNTVGGSRREDLALHPTVKPIGLVSDAIKDVTGRGDCVLDIFLGSGTTLLAAERTGRRFVGTELDPAYADLAIGRWEAMTGRTAERATTGDRRAATRRGVLRAAATTNCLTTP